MLVLLLCELELELALDESTVYAMTFLGDKLAAIVLDATRVVSGGALLAVALEAEAAFGGGVASDAVGGLHLDMDEVVVVVEVMVVLAAVLIGRGSRGGRGGQRGQRGQRGGRGRGAGVCGGCA